MEKEKAHQVCEHLTAFYYSPITMLCLFMTFLICVIKFKDVDLLCECLTYSTGRAPVNKVSISLIATASSKLQLNSCHVLSCLR